MTFFVVEKFKNTRTIYIFKSSRKTCQKDES
jgi:hypothetical protein